jgi:6-phosphogluconolactonase (cycloisomerase 2 family)
MPKLSTLPHPRRFPCVLLSLLLMGSGATVQAFDTYNAQSAQLSIPVVTIGQATFTNMVVVVTTGDIVVPPGGSAPPAGTPDSYNPANNQLTIPEVVVGTTPYYNVTVRVAGLVSIGGVSGADTYRNGELSIAAVQILNGALYGNTVVTVASVVSAGGGMPQHTVDLYNPANNQLTVAAVLYNGVVYTNAVVTVGRRTLPDVVGDTQAAATAVITGAGLALGPVSAQPSTTVPAGVVISQSPAAQTSVTFGTAVSLTVSAGPQSPQFVYATDNLGSTVSQFAIAAGGTLSALTPATVAAGNGPVGIAVDSTGSYVYAANTQDGSVSQYVIGSGGALRPNSPATVNGLSYPIAVATDPRGPYVYVADVNNSTVAQYAIGVGGALSPLNPATVPSDAGPEGLTVDPSGSYVYVACYGSGPTLNASVSQYTLGAGGALSPMNPATVEIAPDIGVLGVTIDPRGPYAYVASGSYGAGIYQFNIGTTGALTPMSTANVSVGSGSSTIAAIVAEPTGRFVYVAVDDFNLGSFIGVYSIGAGGELVDVGSVSAGSAPASLVVAGAYLYSTDEQNKVWQYAINSDGTLTPLTPPSVTVANRPYGIAVAP